VNSSEKTTPVHNIKPFLRGWFHAGAAVSVLPLIGLMCWSCRHDPPRMYSILVFGFSTLALYTVSAIYHIFSWRGIWFKFLRTFDHANIFVVIAGTYTPIIFNVLSDWLRGVMLAGIWLMAASGVVTAFFTRFIHRWVRTGLYIGMGWVSLIALPVILSLLPLGAVAMLILGGILYTLGAVVYGLRWPNPSPRWFGFHEIFHLFVIAGSAAYIIAIWLWVVPFPRS
jgi:hemolysin III